MLTDEVVVGLIARNARTGTIYEVVSVSVDRRDCRIRILEHGSFASASIRPVGALIYSNTEWVTFNCEIVKRPSDPAPCGDGEMSVILADDDDNALDDFHGELNEMLVWLYDNLTDGLTGLWWGYDIRVHTDHLQQPDMTVTFDGSELIWAEV